jgi:hypothetical protein
MDENETLAALEPLDSMPKLLAFVFKCDGEDGILELIGGKLTASEQVADWAATIRAVGLEDLAVLLQRIGATMPPHAALPNPCQPWAFDRERDYAWARWVADHPDDERVQEHELQWQSARSAWFKRTGATPPYPPPKSDA